MNIKKLIGTIIGVAAFAALIAGATFAWISATATINGAVFSDISKEFIIDYSKSNDVSGFKEIRNGYATIASITSATSANETGDAWAAVTASKRATVAPANSFKIKLKVNENSFTTKAVAWALCQNDCPSNTVLATISSGTATCGQGVTNCGTIIQQNNQDILLYDDTITFNTDAAVGTTTYNIYFWIDSDTSNSAGNFSGYIYAEASQSD